MKREIVCKTCLSELRKVLRNRPADSEGPTEFVKFLKGNSRSPFACDQCGKDIAEGSECVALSMWTELIPYFQWEGDFIT